MSIDSIIYLVGLGVFAVAALTYAGYSTDDFWDIEPYLFFLSLFAIVIWPVTLGALLAVAVLYLPYRGGRALAAASDRRRTRKAVEERERIAALHDLRSQYPRDSLTWKVINDSIHEM